jgi:hypothetical protein
LVTQHENGATEALYEKQRVYWFDRVHKSAWNQGYDQARDESRKDVSRLYDRIDDLVDEERKLKDKIVLLEDKLLKQADKRTLSAPSEPRPSLQARIELEPTTLAQGNAATGSHTSVGLTATVPPAHYARIDDEPDTAMAIDLEYAQQYDQAIALSMSQAHQAPAAAALPAPGQSYAQTANLARFIVPAQPATAVRAIKPLPIGKIATHKAKVKPSAVIGPPMPIRLFKEGVPVPLGPGGNPSIMPNSPWSGIRGQEFFASKKGSVVEPPAIGPSHPAFRALAEEAYRIPFDQRSYTQRAVINLALQAQILPPAGRQAQYPVDRLVLNRNDVPKAIRRDDKNRYRSDDLAVWQFLRDGAPSGPNRRAFELKALEILGNGQYLGLVAPGTIPRFWEARHFPDHQPFDEAIIATHYYECGLDSISYESMFRGYAERAMLARADVGGPTSPADPLVPVPAPSAPESSAVTADAPVSPPARVEKRRAEPVKHYGKRPKRGVKPMSAKYICAVASAEELAALSKWQDDKPIDDILDNAYALYMEEGDMDSEDEAMPEPRRRHLEPTPEPPEPVVDPDTLMGPC